MSDSWEVEGADWWWDDDDLDDVPSVKPFFTPEQLKNMDWDATYRVKLIINDESRPHSGE